MSSRSKKKKKSPPSSAAPGAPPAKKDEEGLLGEEVIHVPKGRNRLQYAFMVALLVFLCVIFLIPGAMLATFTGGGRDDPEFVSYNAPGGGEVVTLRASEWQKRRNGFNDIINVFPILKLLVGFEEGSLTDAEAARLMVLEDLAREAGVVVTDEEVAGFLSSLPDLTAERWTGFARRYGGAAWLEANLQKVLAIRRYLDLVGQVARVPDVDAIEERWAEEHVELAFDYAALPVDDLVDEARAEAPDDAALEAWLAELTDAEKRRFYDPARYAATIAVLRDPADADALLERYPDESGESAEARGETYYNAVFFTRFERPEEPEEPEEPEDEGEADDEAGDEAAEDEPPSPFLPLEGVREVAEAEAPAYFAMKAWIEDLRARVEAGEELDFAAEIEAVGLEPIAIDEPATLEELRESAALGEFVVGPVSGTPPGQVAPTPVVVPEGFHAIHVTERVEPGLPELAAIRDEVLDAWAEERAGELALERLAEVRAGFEAYEPEDAADEEDAEPDDADHRRTDEETFRAACEAAGLEVGHRPWLDRSAPAKEDPDASKPAHQHLRQKQGAYGELEVGAVPPPELARTGDAAYLVRLAGKREQPLSEITPQVYESYKQASASRPAMQAREFLTGEGLDEYYGITWHRPTEEELGEESPEEDPTEEGSTEEGSAE